MIFKFSLILSIAVFAATVQAGQLYNHFNHRHHPLRPIHKPDDVLKELKEEVYKALIKAQEALDESENKLNEVANIIQEEAKKQSQGLEDNLRDQLEKLKETVSKEGKNMDEECLKENEDKLIDLPNKLSNAVVQCVSNKVEQGISYAQDTLYKIGKTTDDVENITKRMEDCGRKVICRRRLSDEIGRDTSKLPVKIEADASAAIALMSNFVEQVQKCSSDNLEQLADDGKKILEKIVACANKKTA